MGRRAIRWLRRYGDADLTEQHVDDTGLTLEYRYRITRNGKTVGEAEAESHGAAVWPLHDPSFMDPGEPRTIERLDAALYAAGYELVLDE